MEIDIDALIWEAAALADIPDFDVFDMAGFLSAADQEWIALWEQAAKEDFPLL